ncbi:MAG TPA: aminoacetone oxidase family FAD-binding enzyme, partial [Paracoccaceae bacterium]|nr:aminoacetone oxidase family FAD-binding enzyme [Paracoccaceae bacterium]
MDFDTIILGAGAAGMMCATHAAARGGRVLIIDHAKNPGEKIRISGGGRCNFTNMYAGSANFLSANPHFAKSALKRYTQWDFIELVAKHGIPYHEKTLGQLFCDTSAKDIIAMLLAEMRAQKVQLRLQTHICGLKKTDSGFALEVETEGQRQTLTTQNIVVATGGKSIPKMGATGLGYQIAEQFDLPVTETRPALVPLTFTSDLLDRFRSLAGVALDARVTCGKTSFDEAILFTHRGLSGPAILQISSYWREGHAISVNLMPNSDIFEALRRERSKSGRRALGTVLAEFLPKRLASDLAGVSGLTGNLADISDAALAEFCSTITNWEILP